ncbi:tripartite tricarboxylate transporter substrate binding protein (plasmid) [Variovorax sp. 375MFSha3.1]|uniref:Bug family tripartite tricarboxylate transporter substrate binding protein n=1 Tax=unclassified Variovorax TaxID=663243 RepID=UPI003AAED374
MRVLRSILLSVCCGIVAAVPTLALAFPDKPVQLIVPYAAGGLTDNLARLIAPALSARWGQPVVVDNRNGGGTSIGTAAAARAPGDGYTLLLTAFGYIGNPLLMKNLPYDPAALVPVTIVADAPSVLFVSAKLPVDTVPQLIAYAKAHPKEVVFASSGNGSSPHIAAELLASLTGIEIVHAPYRGNGPALNDLLGGQVQAMFDSSASMSYVRAGRLKALGVASEAPVARLQGMVPIARSGVPQLSNFAAGGWFGFFLPSKTPAELQQRIYADLRAVLETPEVREAIERAGVEPRLMTQPEFAAYLRAEHERWAPVIRERRIQLD